MRRRLIIGAIGAGVAGTATGAQWTVTPSLGLQETVTDNVNYAETNQRADAITQLTPGVTVLGQGARTDVQLSYQPVLVAYAATPGSDQLNQNLIGSGKMEIFTDRLTVATQVFANENYGSGSYYNPQATNLVPNSNRVLDYGGSISPHYTERFGSIATLDVTYSVSTSNSSQQSGGPAGGSGNPYSNNQLQQDARAVVGSGDSFGRLSASLNFDHTDGSGSGVNTGYQNDTDSLNLQYHIDNEWSVLGSAGYQRIHYDPSAQSLGYNNSGLTWDAGFRLAPNDTTALQVTYGKQQGSYNINATLNYTLLERTLINASYLVQVENQLQSAFTNLPFLTHDQFGRPIDSRTGLPYNPANQPFGQQNTLFRDKSAQVNITRQMIRSTISLSVYDDTREPIDGTASTDESWGMSVTYHRDLTQTLGANLDLGYNTHLYGASVLTGTGGGTDHYLNADFSMSFAINQYLNANMIYSHYRRFSTQSDNSSTVDQLTLGLTASF